jgi:cytochrome c
MMTDRPSHGDQVGSFAMAGRAPTLFLGLPPGTISLASRRPQNCRLDDDARPSARGCNAAGRRLSVFDFGTVGRRGLFNAQARDIAAKLGHSAEPAKFGKQKSRISIMRLMAFLIFVSLSIAPLRAAPSEYGSKDEAVAMVKLVQEKFKKDGAEATFKAITDTSTKEFHDRDLYPFVYDLTGVSVAHGAIRALIGKNLMDMKDQDGKYFFKEMIDIAKGPGTGWVDYKWPNPVTAKIQDKSAYVEKLGDNYFVGVGIYLYKQ